MRHETLDRPNLASRKKSVERSLRRVILDHLVVRTDRKRHRSRFPVSVKRYATISSYAAASTRALYPGNENKINELFVVRFPWNAPSRGFSSMQLDRNRLNFISSVLFPLVCHPR